MRTFFHKFGKPKSLGFTLIELLTVIAIIGILAAIIIPTVGAVRKSANKAKTRVQFTQWATSMELFKQEYGYYPAIDSGHLVVPASFFAALTAKTYNGNAATDLMGNKKKLSFYSPSDSEISLKSLGDANDGDLKDAFGNTDLAIFYDKDGDGVIKTGDGLAVTPVKSFINTAPVSPLPGTAAGNLDTTNGVRAGVIFYSAGYGSSASDIVFSWQ